MFVFSHFFQDYKETLKDTFVMGFDTILAPSTFKPLVDPSESLLKLQVPKEHVLCNLILRGYTISNTLHYFYKICTFFPHW